MNKSLQAVLVRYPLEDDKKARKKICESDTGLHLFFRKIKGQVLLRMHDLLSIDAYPKVFLHGSVHIDNYATTEQGSGMIDFDRAYYGPHAWDLVCFSISLFLRQETPTLLPIEHFLDAYRQAHFKPYHIQTTKQKDWLKKSARHPIDDTLAMALLHAYCQSRAIAMLQPKSIGLVPGSAGRMHFIYDCDDKIIDIKPTKHYLSTSEAKHQHYTHDFAQHGERLIAASQLYAPHVIQGQGSASLYGQDYWGRELPSINAKLKGQLCESVLCELAHAVGGQIGQGHQQSCKQVLHFNRDDEIIKVAKQLISEITLAWQYYKQIA